MHRHCRERDREALRELIEVLDRVNRQQARRWSAWERFLGYDRLFGPAPMRETIYRREKLRRLSSRTERVTYPDYTITVVYSTELEPSQVRHIGAVEYTGRAIHNDVTGTGWSAR